LAERRIPASFFRPILQFCNNFATIWSITHPWPVSNPGGLLISLLPRGLIPTSFLPASPGRNHREELSGSKSPVAGAVCFMPGICLLPSEFRGDEASYLCIILFMASSAFCIILDTFFCDIPSFSAICIWVRS